MGNPFSDFTEGLREGFDRAAYEAGMRDAWHAAQQEQQQARVTAAQQQQQQQAPAQQEPRKGGKGMRIAALICATLVVLAYVGKPAAPATATVPQQQQQTQQQEQAPGTTFNPDAKLDPGQVQDRRPAPMPACQEEDGSTPGQSFPCLWDARTHGNGKGDSFILNRPGD